MMLQIKCRDKRGGTGGGGMLTRDYSVMCDFCYLAGRARKRLERCWHLLASRDAQQRQVLGGRAVAVTAELGNNTGLCI
jgi:hypothetical protein